MKLEQREQHGVNLRGQLSGWRYDDGPDTVFFDGRIESQQALNNGYQEAEAVSVYPQKQSPSLRQRLSAACDGFYDDI